MARLRSAKRLRLLRPGSKKSRSLRTRGTFTVEICTGGKVILHFALAGSGAPVQTNGLRIQARQRYASKAAVLCIQSQQGVLQPLLVRTIEDDKYEVIAGARRLRAAKLAALEEVPVRVVELSDAACVETQLVENIQRENAHPLEEALAFHGLLHTDGLQYDIAILGAKTGKSPAFVATRLRLVELHPSIAEAFLADEIGVGHALEIAKLPQQEQQRAFDGAFHTVWNGGKETRILRPVRDLTAWIEQNILLALDSVAFDKNDETLVPEAGSCVNC